LDSAAGARPCTITQVPRRAVAAGWRGLAWLDPSEVELERIRDTEPIRPSSLSAKPLSSGDRPGTQPRNQGGGRHV
jgi:hypothetical protein